MDPKLIATLKAIYDMENSAFIRYLGVAAEAVVKDDLDRKVEEHYRDWLRANELNLNAFRDLLVSEGERPPEVRWPIRYAEFNFLKASYLLATVIRFMEETLARIESLKGALAEWPRASELVDAVLEREKPLLERSRELAKEAAAASHESAQAPEGDDAPHIKGTSASRW